MKYNVGSPVSGDDFYDRKREMAQIWRYLDSDNLLLLAPRRVGKTSLMKRLVEDAPKHSFQAIYITVEGAIDEADFVQRLCRAAAQTNQQLKTSLNSLLKRIKKVSAVGVSVELSEQSKKNWADSMRLLGDNLAAIEEPWLLAVDELPLFILKLLRADSSGERAANFLHSLRELRQNQPRLRWLLAGSIGLDTVAGRHNLGDTINDLRITGLGPFEPATANAFLLELAASYRLTLTPQRCCQIVERLEWPLPYYLQLIFSELLDFVEEGKKATEPATVNAIFERLLDPAHKNYFDYWRQRLHEELGSPDDGNAIALLNAICRTPQGAPKETLRAMLAQRIHDPDERDTRLGYLLDILENDGYLIRNEKSYRFRLPLLREYWRRRVAQ